MADLVPESRRTFDDGNGVPYAGAKAYFYDAGTLNDRTVYQEAAESTAHAQPVVADANGRFADIYAPTGSYRLVVKTSADVTIYDSDNREGELDTSSFLTTATPTIPVISKTTAYTTVSTTDKGKLIKADATGGAFTITLDAAADYADGGVQFIKHPGTANEVTIDANGAETIDGELTIALGPKESVLLITDGSSWSSISLDDRFNDPVTLTYGATVTPDLSDGDNFILTLTGNVTTFASPSNASVGQRGYIIFIQDGTGGRTIGAVGSDWKFGDDGLPALSLGASDVDVWEYFVRAANTIDVWRVKRGEGETFGTWDYVATHEENAGTNGGNATSGAWEVRGLNTVKYDRFSYGSPSSGRITLPAGTYEAEWWDTGYQVGSFISRLFNATDSSDISIGSAEISPGVTSITTAKSVGWGRFTISASKGIEIQHQVTTTNAGGDGYGVAANINSKNEVYAMLKIRRV